MDIICQCEYGQSRSAGCAAAIREHFYSDGIKIFADYRYYPNQLVYNKVFDALEGLKNSVGNDAFGDCWLNSVTVPDSVTEIKGRAFSGCRFLEEINIPEGIKEIS